MKPVRANAFRDRWGGDLRPSDAGNEVRVAGWVHRRRDHGGLVFIDLRDRTGLVQLVFHPEQAEAHAAAARAALRARHLGDREGRRPRRAQRQPEHAHRRDRDRRSPPSTCSPTPRRRRSDRRATGPSTSWSACATARSTCAARRCATRSCCATRSRRDPRLPRQRRTSSTSRRRCSRARRPEGARDFLVPARTQAGLLLRAAAVPAAVQAAADDRRLRALLPDRPLLPRRGRRARTASPSSPSSTWRCPSSRRTTSSRSSRGCSRRSSRPSASRASRPRRGRASPTPRRCSSTAPTAPTAATAWRSPTSRTRSVKRSSRSSPARSRPVASSAGSTRAAREVPRKDLDALTETAKQFGAKGLVWGFVEEDGSWRSPVAKFLREDEIGAIDRGARRVARRPAAARRRRGAHRRDRSRRPARGPRRPLRPARGQGARHALDRRVPDVRLRRGRRIAGTRCTTRSPRRWATWATRGRWARAGMTSCSTATRSAAARSASIGPRGPAPGARADRLQPRGGPGALRLPARRPATTARRPTAGSPSASTASSGCSPAGARRSATRSPSRRPQRARIR